MDGDVLEDGDIVLLHDTHLNMVDAVKIIVPKLIDEGYQLVTVWELLNCAPSNRPFPGIHTTIRPSRSSIAKPHGRAPKRRMTSACSRPRNRGLQVCN